MKKYDDYDLRKGRDGYEWALEVAGAKVLAYKSFGSYQGDWFAKVEYKDKKGWIKGSYGSCSVCDAWKSEAGYMSRTKKEWKKLCTNFAQEYLNNILTFEEVLSEAKENLSWDLEAKGMVEWLEKNK